MLTLQFRKLAALGRVICQLVIGEERTRNNVGSHDWKAPFAGWLSPDREFLWVDSVETMRPCQSISIDVDHSLRRRLRSFLGQVVADAAGDDPACIFAGEFLAIGRRGGR